MITKTFLRWSAAAVLTGSVILCIGYLLRANIDKKFINEFASTQGLISSLMVGIGSLLFLFGLPFLFATQNLYSSKSGIVASLLGFTSMAAFHLGTLALYFVLPVLVNHNEATRALIYSDEPPFPRFAIFWAISLLMQVIGLLWIGIKTQRNSELRLSSILLIAAAIIFLVAPFIYFPLIKSANTLSMLGFAIAAVRVLRSKESTVCSETAIALMV